MQIPFFRQIQNSWRILIAGGYDLASGIPLHLYLQSLGKYTVLANLSFSQLAESGCEAVFPNCYLIDENAANLPYFPEKHIAEWLAGSGCRAPVYAFAKTGVRPLRDAYRHLREKHRLDTVILADGGTDSLMFGDEWATGTIVEDSLSVIAANAAGFEHRYLAAVGFGVEHDLDHYTLLQNMAELTRAQAFLGAQSITAQMPRGCRFSEPDRIPKPPKQPPQHRYQRYCRRHARQFRRHPFQPAHRRLRTVCQSAYAALLVFQAR